MFSAVRIRIRSSSTSSAPWPLGAVAAGCVAAGAGSAEGAVGRSRLRRRLCGGARPRRQIRLDVLPGDPSPVTGAGHLGDVDLVLSDQLAHHRRKQVGLRLRLVGCGEEGVDLGRRGCLFPQRRWLGGRLHCCGGFFDHIGSAGFSSVAGVSSAASGSADFSSAGAAASSPSARSPTDGVPRHLPLRSPGYRGSCPLQRSNLGVDLVGGYLDEDLILGERPPLRPIDRVHHDHHPPRSRARARVTFQG